MNLRLVLPFLALFSLGGCILVRTPPTRVVRVQRECHPSEYWDGYRCVHKGKAKGHHKHDAD